MGMQAPYRWAKLSPGISQDEAHAAYRVHSLPPAPCGRFGHGSALVNVGASMLLLGVQGGCFYDVSPDHQGSALSMSMNLCAQDTLYMYGGHDGGMSRHGKQVCWHSGAGAGSV